MEITKHLNEFTTKQIKSLSHHNDGILVNHKILIDNDGTLWNDANTIKPYKTIPLYYYNLRDLLLKNLA